MTHALRFAVLQIILASAIVAAWFEGVASRPFNGESRYFSIFVLAVGAIGLGAIYRRRFTAATWIATILVRVAIVGMLVGCITALASVSTSVLGGDDVTKVAALFLGSIGIAFYVSLCAILSNLWLELNLFLLDDAQD